MAKTSTPAAKPARTRAPRFPKAVAAAVRAARDKKAFDLVVLDLRKAGGFTDYFDFVVHVFSRDCRSFYALERLWGAAERHEFPDVE